MRSECEFVAIARLTPLRDHRPGDMHYCPQLWDSGHKVRREAGDRSLSHLRSSRPSTRRGHRGGGRLATSAVARPGRYASSLRRRSCPSTSRCSPASCWARCDPVLSSIPWGGAATQPRYLRSTVGGGRGLPCSRGWQRAGFPAGHLGRHTAGMATMITLAGLVDERRRQMRVDGDEVRSWAAVELW